MLDEYQKVLGKSLIGSSDPKETETGLFDQKTDTSTFVPKLIQNEATNNRPLTINNFVPKPINTQTTSPSLLGGNIVDQAKNMEILQRRNQ